MLLLATATDMEMRACLSVCRDSSRLEPLVTGIGPMETACTMTARLAKGTYGVQAVLHFGIAGAYLQDDNGGAGLLDICLAEEEILGDLGICHRESIERFGGHLPVRDRFVLDSGLFARAKTFLERERIPYHRGRFVTVNCASGTLERGTLLRSLHGGLCENMEGAAVARACEAFGIPCLEIRCISNLVEDRQGSRWELKKACARAGRVAAGLAEDLLAANVPQPRRTS